MMARSMRSNQRPDTLMQDRLPLDRRRLLQRTAGPYIRVRSDQFQVPASCLLLAQQRPNRCAAVSEATAARRVKVALYPKPLRDRSGPENKAPLLGRAGQVEIRSGERVTAWVKGRRRLFRARPTHCGDSGLFRLILDRRNRKRPAQKPVGNSVDLCEFSVRKISPAQ